MTEIIGTARFHRTVKVRDYESASAGVELQFDIPHANGDNTEWGTQVLAAIKDAMFQAKAAVFEELGLDFSVDEGGVVREALNATFGKVTEITPTPQAVSAAPAAVASTSGTELADTPPYEARTTNRDERNANQRWAKARLAAHPDEFWDNREDKRNGKGHPKGPDFKHKSTGVGVWES